MKKANVQTEVLEVMNESKKTKGAKISNSVNSTSVQPTRKETKANFVSFIVSKEEISISKFFRLLNEWKAEQPLQYSEYISAHKLNLQTDYTFDWFKTNCPTNEKGLFSKWTKVSESVLANKKEEYNRVTEKGVIYTLIPFNTSKANYEQFLNVFISVVTEINRIEREKKAKERKKERESKQREKEAKLEKKLTEKAKDIFEEIEKVSMTNSIPFELALNVYSSLQKTPISENLRNILLELKNKSK